MAKDMSNIDIRAYEGGDFDVIDDNYTDRQIQAAIANRAEKAFEAFEDIKEEVEELKNNPDVVDIVATYADLQAYDTQHLTDKDIIRVLADENHDGESTYYRYNKQSDSWTYIGTVGDYYTKTAADTKFQDKLTAGSNITIDANNEISATDTTYSAFTGTDGTSAGTAGLVPAPATTDAGKFLKADGTWDDAGSSMNVVQTTGTSTTDVMSQNATTSMVFADPSTKQKVQIGSGASASRDNTISVGANSSAAGNNSVAIGNGAEATTGKDYAVALGASSTAGGVCSLALPGSTTGNQGVIQVGLNRSSGWASYGYNNSAYRLLTGLYDGSSAHDAATYGQMNTRLGGLTLLTISQTDYDNLDTKDPDTLYIITGA